MSLPLRGVAVYNPALLSKDELLSQFIARRALLEVILTDLRTQERPDHRVLLGQRGMGKTTLLRRIYFGVEDDPRLSQRWIALPFPEEQYNLARLSDFYLNCVDALGDALVHRDRILEADGLDRMRDALPDDDEETRADAARDLLLSMANKLGRKLLLLVDNVEMVLDRLASSQWKLRELLGHDSRLCLIGASAYAPESTFQYKQAFYEFFRFHELRPLQEDEARDLLLHLAKVRGAVGIDRVLSEEPARIRTLLTLSGGNPRTLVQLYAVLSQSTEGDARSDLERLLDECTPIYKARFEASSVQAQHIVDAAALHWHPVTAADLATATRLDVNVVSSQVSRLLKEGVLEAVPAPEGPRKAYQITERFFNIWHLMRASRRQRQRLVWLVEFLRLFYSQDELPAHAKRRLTAGVSGELDNASREAEYCMALAQAVEDRALRRALVSSAIHSWARNAGTSDKMAELLELAPADAPAKPIADRHKAMAELHRKVLKAKVTKKGWDAAKFWELLGGSGLPLARKAAMVSRLEKASTKTIRSWMEALESELEGLRKAVRCDVALGALRRALQDGDMESVTDIEGGEAAALALSCPELRTLVWSLHVTRQGADARDPKSLSELERAVIATPAMAFGWRGLAFSRAMSGQTLAAEEAYRKALEADPDHATAWLELGAFLKANHEPERYREAEAALRKAIGLDPTNADAWYWLGEVLRAGEGDDREAEGAYRRAIELSPSDPYPWVGLGNLLSRDRPKEAEEALRQAIKLDPNHRSAWNDLGDFLESRGRHQDAVDAYKRAVAEPEPWPGAWINLGHILARQLERPEDAEAAYRKAATFEETRPAALYWLSRHRYQRGLVDAETEQWAREMAIADPDPTDQLFLASILVRRNLWDEPVRLARDAIHADANTNESRLSPWGATLSFFAEVIRSKGAEAALALLEDYGLSERWLPMRAALTAARDGERALLGFAPEVRRPAETLLQHLLPKEPRVPVRAKKRAPPSAKRSSKPVRRGQ